MVKATMTTLGDLPRQAGPNDPRRTNIITITSKSMYRFLRMFANSVVIPTTIITTLILRNPAALFRLRT